MPPTTRSRCPRAQAFASPTWRTCGTAAAPGARSSPTTRSCSRSGQLGRPLHLLAPGEDLLTRISKYVDTPYPFGKILGLTKKGWVRGEPQDAGVECWITRPFPDGAALVARLDPGIIIGLVDEFPEISFTSVWYSPSGRGDWSAPKDAPPTYDVDPITTSELLAELESLQP